MWAGRTSLTTLQHAVAVPPAVRAAVDLPADQLAMFRTCPSFVSVLTNRDAPAYEMHFAVDAAPEVVRAMWTCRDREPLERLLPPDADAQLPIVRDVTLETRACAIDVLVSDQTVPPTFPFKANVLVYSEQDARQGDFSTPLAVRPGLTVNFDH